MNGYQYKRYSSDSAEETVFNSLTDSMKEKVIQVINNVYNYNLSIELIGEWLWVTGDTKAVKEVLKVNGFKFSRKKEAWYYHEMEGYRRFSKRGYSLNEIRSRYGTSRVSKTKETETRELVAA